MHAIDLQCTQFTSVFVIQRIIFAIHFLFSFYDLSTNSNKDKDEDNNGQKS